jgi:hypothetical protein
VHADNTDDNHLEPLFEGLRVRWSLDVSGVYPAPSEVSTYNRKTLKDSDIPHDYTLSVDGSGTPVKSYLYLFVSDYYQPSMVWTIEFNENVLIEGEHSDSIAGNPRGDGRLDHERATILFDVTGLVKKGSNTLTITDVDSTQNYFFDGAILLNFYPSEEEHIYWVSNGVEYLEKVNYEDVSYDLKFEGSSYEDPIEATLYTVFQNEEQEHDAIYFNDNLLKDKGATYLLKGSDLVSKTFSVKELLNNNDKVTFTMERYQTDDGSPFIQYSDNPIYTSIVILDIKLPPKPQVVVLSNSFDSVGLSELTDFMGEEGLEVIHSTADDFDYYKDQKFIIILGGPDAAEGIGKIVRDTKMLSITEVDYVREKGNRKKFMAANPWGQLKDQTVWIIAGSDRTRTLQAILDYRQGIKEELVNGINQEEPETETKMSDPCSPSENNPFTHVWPDKIKDLYICGVVYAEGVGKWKITLYNQGDDEENIYRYILVDHRDTTYRLTSSDKDILIQPSEHWTIYGKTFNPEGDRKHGIFLRNTMGSLSLWDSSENVVDMVKW